MKHLVSNAQVNEKNEARLTLKCGLEFENAEGEELVKRAAEWYCKARIFLLSYALKNNKTRVQKIASLLKSEGFPSPPHPRLIDLLQRTITPAIKNMRRLRRRYPKTLRAWFDRVKKFAEEKGSDAAERLQPYVEDLLQLVKNLPINSPAWDTDAQEKWKELKKLWGKVRESDWKKGIVWKFQIPNPKKPPSTPAFRCADSSNIFVTADYRMSGKNARNSYDMKTDSEENLWVLVRLDDVDGDVKVRKDVWIKLCVDKSRYDLLRIGKITEIKILRNRDGRWEGRIVVKMNAGYNSPQVVVGVDVGASEHLIAAVGIPLDGSNNNFLLSVPASYFWKRVEQAERLWRRWQRLYTGRTSEKKKAPILPRRRKAYQILKRNRNWRREVTKHCIFHAVKKFVQLLPPNSVVVVENLKDIPPNVWKEDKDKRFRRWVYAFLLFTLKYKCQQRKIAVIAVSPHNTSQTCPRCGVVDPKSRGLWKDGELISRKHFCCTQCKFTHNADFVAAHNIAVLGAKALGITLPESWRALRGEVQYVIPYQNMPKVRKSW